MSSTPSPYALYQQYQLNGTMDQQVPGYFIPVPASNTDGFHAYNGTSCRWEIVPFPSSITWNHTSGVLSLTAPVATSGSYTDLTNKPTIPAAQVNSDWSAVTGLPQILNKPSLATVATSGLYSDLTGKPTLTTGTVTSVGITSTDLTVTSSPITSTGSIGLTLATVAAAGTYSNVTVNTKGLVTSGTGRSFNNTASHALVTVAAAANGFQISSTRDAEASYTINMTLTATILALASGYVVFEICATNSAVAANWIEVGRVASSQTLSLASLLQSVLTFYQQITGFVPAGYYSRLRSVTVGGTLTFGANGTGQEVLL